MADSSTTDKPTKNRSSRKKANAAEPKLEALLWAAADKLRGHMDAAEYKHVVLGLIFLKYISDAFEEHRKSLEDQFSDPANELYIDKPLDRYTTLEDRDEYTAANIFWVPQEAVLIKELAISIYNGRPGFGSYPMWSFHRGKRFKHSLLLV